MQRRLAAILAADVVGYSRMLEADEAGTLAVLKDIRKRILEPLVSKHHGRIVKLMGDGVLIEFGSAVEAVQCAADLQRAMGEANEGLPTERAILLRVGVNLGDVVVEGGDLFGDGVNIAARLESIAEPGAIIISGTVYDHVKGKLKLSCYNLGQHQLKNISEPVQVYRVSYQEGGRPGPRPNLSRGTKPSIAVLPFDNMSGDPEQQYFSDGITEDIITELSRFHSLFVIARNSSFQYREKAIDVRRVGRELAVRYVVEGSVRKAGDRLRISAQLIDAETGNHLWADRYDRRLDDVFEVQDEVVRSIVIKLEGRLAATGAEQAGRKPTEHLAAYDCVLQARAHLYVHGAAKAEPLLLRAIELDPGYAQAYAWLARSTLVKFFSDSRTEVLDKAIEYGRIATSLDGNDGICHWGLANALLFGGEFDQAAAHFERALALNPNDVVILSTHCNWLARVGRVGEALQILDQILIREAFPPFWYWEVRSVALMQARRYGEAIAAIKRKPYLLTYDHAYLASCYAEVGEIDQARAQAEITLRMMPDFSITWLLQQEPFKDPADTKRFVEMLRKSGLPE